MGLPRLIFLVLLLAGEPAFARVCDEKMQDGAVRSSLRGEPGFMATGSVTVTSSVEPAGTNSLFDAAELKAKHALRNVIPGDFLLPKEASLRGVVVLVRCMQSGRAYARAWVSENSLKFAKSQARLTSDSLSENPTPKPQEPSPSLLDEKSDPMTHSLPTKKLDSLGL